MRNRLILPVLGLVALSASVAVANMIGLGLNWKSGIFVQEYWLAGTPHYLIANTTAQNVTISAGAAHLRAEDEHLNAGPAPLVVDVPAKDVVDVDASALRSLSLVDIRAGDQDLGLLTPPKWVGHQPVKDPVIRTIYGLNGSGGSSTDTYMEQARTSCAPGETVTIILKLAAAFQKVTTRPANANLGLPCAELKSVVGPTVVVTHNADGTYTIEPPKNVDRAVAVHTVTLTYTMPGVKMPTLALIDLSLQYDGGGRGITRGIYVRP